MHRDLKLPNVLLQKSTSGLPIPKIGDFGFAVPILSENENLTMTLCNITSQAIGTPLNMSPEIHNKMAYNYQTDIWSFGTMMFELLTGKCPFMALTIGELSKNVNNGIYYIKAEFMPSAYFIDFIQKCLQHNAKDRIRMSELIIHPFLTASKEKLMNSQKSKLVMNDIKNGVLELSTKRYVQYLEKLDYLVKKETTTFLDFEVFLL